ncbi:MOSC domain-containing protein [Acetobacterium fimetarium]|uniref:MOSC domain-containing protein n=1 Tax=Acetobacterium fimetarium TaxID=52691 RepID=A0ABR6WRK7_9FIRM|nr:MOSC domain-containing protein [Acetobacterium fimetarium]MBC3803005.1 MOSC domain-containing protein [Acetobacterium fimetarium]
MAKVIAVNISDKKGVIKHPVAVGECLVDFGIKGDAHGGNWHRQISLLGQESIDKMTAMGVAGLDPGKFAENLTTEGIELFTLPVGTQMEINGVLLEVTQIGKECHKGCAIKQQVGDCIMPREGIFVKVLKNGEIRPGDEIIIK